MPWLYYILLIAVLVVGLFINLLGLPGLWLMVAGVGAFAWATSSAMYVSNASLIALVVLALVAEVVEFIAGSAGAKSAGGSKRAMAGAIVGGLIGGIFFSFVPIPVISTIVGVCLGAFIGAAVVELLIFRDVGLSMRVGIGAAKGRFYGMMSKMLFGLVMLLIALAAALPVGGRRTTTVTTSPSTANNARQP